MPQLIIPYSFVTKSISLQQATSTGNWANSGGTYDTATGGSLPETYDSNEATYLRWYAHHNGDGAIEARMQTDYVWTFPIQVTSCYFSTYMGTFGGNYKNGEMHNYLYLRINGVWTQVLYNGQGNMQGIGSNTAAWRSWTASSSAGWTGVSGIRMYCYQQSYSYEGNRQQWVDMHMNEVTVLGNVGGAFAGCI